MVEKVILGTKSCKSKETTKENFDCAEQTRESGWETRRDGEGIFCVIIFIYYTLHKHSTLTKIKYQTNRNAAKMKRGERRALCIKPPSFFNTCRMPRPHVIHAEMIRKRPNHL